jgi:hypothetical protein
MNQGYSLKAPNKPTLFTWDLDTEFNNVDKWVSSHRYYYGRDIEKEKEILKMLSSDYLQIIQANTLEPKHLENLTQAIISGPSGVWEQAATKLGRLAYHFSIAKEKIQELIFSTNSKTTDRALTMLNNSFTDGEQIKILEKTLSNKSKKIRERAASMAYYLNNNAFAPVLEERIKTEEDERVKDSIRFAIENLKKN